MPGDPIEDFARDLEADYRVEDGVISGACIHRQQNGRELDTYHIYLLLPRDRSFVHELKGYVPPTPPAEQISGWVVEVTAPPDSVMTNVGYGYVSRTDVQIQENHGGVWTTELLRRAAADIMNNPLYLDFSTLDAFHRQPTRSCPLMD
jgi:hypothetical protein